MNYLREHATGRVYQIALSEAIYYGPNPVWGDALGPWRYSDFISLPPPEMARKLAETGLRGHRHAPAAGAAARRPDPVSTIISP